MRERVILGYICSLFFVFVAENLYAFSERDYSDKIQLTFIYRTAQHFYFSYTDTSLIYPADEISIIISDTLILKGIIDAVSSSYILLHLLDSGNVRLKKDCAYQASVVHRAVKRQKSSLDSTVRKPREMQTSSGIIETQKVTDAVSQNFTKSAIRDTVPQAPNYYSKKRKIRGLISMEYYQSDALGRDRYNFQQPSAVLKFYGRNIAGTNWEVRMHSRSKQDRRKRLGMIQYKSEYLNRIYEAALHYDNPASRFDLSVGRLFSPQLVSVGYLDGTTVSIRALSWFRAGGFIGTQPDIDRGDLKTDVVKSGGFVEFFSQSVLMPFSSSFALTHQTRNGRTDRDFLYMQNRINFNRRVSLYQSGEFNYRNGWQRTQGNEIDLVNFYGSLRYSLRRQLSLGLQYDARKNYRSLLNLTIPDSLFDSNTRQGMRLNLSGNVFSKTTMFGSVGIRGNPAGGSVSSYSVGINNRDVFGTQFTGNFQISGFTSGYSSGLNPSLGIGKSFFVSGFTEFTVGLYRYRVPGWSVRNTSWIRLNQTLDLFSRWFVSMELEYNRGDDARSFQTFLLGGIRF